MTSLNQAKHIDFMEKEGKRIVLIPAYNPNGKLVSLLQRLTECDFDRIVVINDGSKFDCRNIFMQIAKFQKVDLLTHSTNLGKGAAIKTGLDHIYTKYTDCNSIVTADADGQHLDSDIIKVSRSLQNRKKSLIMGSRKFGGSVPLRSKIGNILSGYLTKTIHNINKRFLVYRHWFLNLQNSLKTLQSPLPKPLLVFSSPGPDDIR